MTQMASLFARSLVIRTASVLAFIIVWHLLVLLFEPALLPSPLAVIENLGWQLTAGELPHHLAVTLKRVAFSFLFAMVFGVIVGLLMGHFRKLDAWLDSMVTLALHIPALVTIILCFIWFGLNEVATVVAVTINKAPNVIVTMREGAKAVDGRLLAVARVYQVPFVRMLRRVYLPQLYPYLLASARTGIALVWKIVLVVELIGCSEGIGFQLGVYFQYFDITSILAYTLAFVCVIFLVESALLKPWERSVMRWRV